MYFAGKLVYLIVLASVQLALSSRLAKQGVQSWLRSNNFRDFGISCFEVEMWNIVSDINPPTNPTC